MHALPRGSPWTQGHRDTHSNMERDLGEGFPTRHHKPLIHPTHGALYLQARALGGSPPPPILYPLDGLSHSQVTLGCPSQPRDLLAEVALELPMFPGPKNWVGWGAKCSLSAGSSGCVYLGASEAGPYLGCPGTGAPHPCALSRAGETQCLVQTADMETDRRRCGST